jgi:hypothetical protein
MELVGLQLKKVNASIKYSFHFFKIDLGIRLRTGIKLQLTAYFRTKQNTLS